MGAGWPQPQLREVCDHETGFVYALVTVAAVFTASAEDFPLTFRTIPAQEVMSFPGGPGSFGQLRLAKPAKLKQEPKAMSRHPLYGECAGGASGAAFIFRLDESKGTAGATTSSLWI